MEDTISRQAAIEKSEMLFKELKKDTVDMMGIGYNHAVADNIGILKNLPSAEAEEVIPHRNYKYLSDFWCECGWHLGKKGEVKYCAECGKKVKWDE